MGCRDFTPVGWYRLTGLSYRYFLCVFRKFPTKVNWKFFQNPGAFQFKWFLFCFSVLVSVLRFPGWCMSSGRFSLLLAGISSHQKTSLDTNPRSGSLLDFPGIWADPRHLRSRFVPFAYILFSGARYSVFRFASPCLARCSRIHVMCPFYRFEMAWCDVMRVARDYSLFFSFGKVCNVWYSSFFVPVSTVFKASRSLMFGFALARVSFQSAIRNVMRCVVLANVCAFFIIPASIVWLRHAGVGPSFRGKRLYFWIPFFAECCPLTWSTAVQ